MSELTLTIIRLGFLAVLWLFALTAVSVMRSDLFGLNASYDIVPTGGGSEPLVDLDSHYTLINDFDARVPRGVPSLAAATSFRVVGDVTFGADVVCVGDVVVTTEGSTPVSVADGTRLEGTATV